MEIPVAQKTELDKLLLLERYTQFASLPAEPMAIEGLPFGSMTWEAFEALIFQLLCLEYGVSNCTPYGVRGQDQEGLDVLVNLPDHSYAVYQCKRVKQFKAAELKAEFSLFESGSWFEAASQYHLASSDHLQDTGFVKAFETFRNKHSGKLSISRLGSNELNGKLRILPGLVARFFGVHWIRAFCDPVSSKVYFAALKPQPIRPDHAPVENYIPRKLKTIKSELPGDDVPEQSLFEATESHLQKGQGNILVRSHAAYGKTTELLNLASRLNTEMPQLLTLFARLKHYVVRRQGIADFLEDICPNWRNFSPEPIILILDGLDEIPLDDFPDFTRELGSFLSKTPASVVMSIRTNFFKDGFLERIRESRKFTELGLHELTETEIEAFLGTTLQSPSTIQEFKDICNRGKLSDLLFIPFYLVNLAKIFIKSRATFPKGHKDAMEQIVNFSCIEDAVRYDLITSPAEILGSLKKLAVGLSLKGQNTILSSEAEKITGLAVDILRKSSIVSIEPIGMDFNISFIHGNFHEYLFAQVLSLAGGQQIGIVLFSKEQPNRLRPKFLNVTNFLFSILEKKSSKFVSLFTKLIDHNVESLILFEKDKVAYADRLIIFERIVAVLKLREFYFLKDNTLDGATLWDYVDFSFKSLELVISSIHTGNSSSCAAFLDLVKEFPGIRLTGSSREKLMAGLDEIVAVPYEYFIHDRAIDIMKDFQLFNAESLCSMKNCSNIGHKMVRGAVFDYIMAWGKSAEELEFLLESWSVFIDPKYRISAGLEHKYVATISVIMDSGNYRKIMSYLISRGGDIAKIFKKSTYSGNPISRVYAKLGAIYKIGPEHSDAEDLLIAFFLLVADGDREEMGNLGEFYAQTTSRLSGIIRLIESGVDGFDAKVWIELVDSELILEVITAYAKKEIEKNIICEIRMGLGRKGAEGAHAAFQKMLVTCFPGEFEYAKEEDDGDILAVAKRANDFILVDDRELFLKEAEKLFGFLKEITGKEECDWDDFIHLEYHERYEVRRSCTSEIVLNTVRENDFKGNYTAFKRLIEAEEFSWDAFRFNTVFGWLDGISNPPVPDELKAKVKTYFEEYFRPHLDLENGITEGKDGRFTVANTAFVYAKLFRQGICILDKSELAELLLFDFSGNFINDGNEENLLHNGPLHKIIHQLMDDQGFFEQAVRDHIQERRIHSNSVMRTYTSIVLQHEITGLGEDFASLLIEERWNEETKNYLLKAYLLDSSPEMLTGILSALPAIACKWHWRMLQSVEKLYGCNGDYLGVVEAKMPKDILHMDDWEKEMIVSGMQNGSKVVEAWFFDQLGQARDFDCRDEQVVVWSQSLTNGTKNLLTVMNLALGQLDNILLEKRDHVWCRRKQVVHQILKNILVQDIDYFNHIISVYKSRIRHFEKQHPLAKDHYGHLYDFEKLYYAERIEHFDQSLVDEILLLV